MPGPETEQTAVAAEESAGPAVWKFIDSPVYETLLSMQSLLVDWYDEPWTEEARETMGVAFLRDLRTTFEPFRLGADLFELAVPESSPQEVDAFVRHVREMSFAEFSYFSFGRLIPVRGGELIIDPEEVRKILENFGDYAHYVESLGRPDWAEIGPLCQRRLADLTETFWNKFFTKRLSSFAAQHSVSIAQNQAYGRENGFDALYVLLTGKEKTCRPLSPDAVLRQVSFVPVANITQPSLVYTGEQDVTVIYHASRTAAKLSELSERERRLIAISRALGDRTRFRIVKLLFQNRDVMNGQNIAERVQVTKSVVSKHLAQLKDAGIVQESSPDKRNNIYSIDLDVIREISPSLVEVLRG